MSNQKAFLAAVEIYRASISSEYDGNSIKGQLVLTSEIINWLNHLIELFIDIRVNNESIIDAELDKYIDRTASFEISVPSGQKWSSYFCKTLDDLLDRPKHCKKFPNRLYIVDSNTLIPDESNSLIEKYKKATLLVDALINLADFPMDSEFSILAPDRIDIAIIYKQEDLVNARFDALDKILAEILPATPDHHSERRQEIFKNVLGSMVNADHKNERLGKIFRHLDEIYTRYRRDYDLYAKDFTFAKLFADFEEQKAKQTKALNDVVQGMSGKLLSIPLAYIVIAGQLVNNGGMKNHIIIIGAFVFAVFMILMVGNQLLTLRHVKQDVDNLKASYKGTLDESILSVSIKQLLTKYRVQYGILWSILYITAIIFALAFSLYVEYTEISWMQRIL